MAVATREAPPILAQGQNIMTASLTARDLAGTFAAVLREWLTPEQLAEIDRINAESTSKGDTLVCATHDYCDANEAMLLALERHGVEYSADLHDTINLAWEIAKARGFSA